MTGGRITSGGGFSEVYTRSDTAPWQETLVNKYLSYGVYTPPDSYFATTGRAYPDLSAYANNYFVYLNGEIIRESGTSASTPAVAAMVTLWNDMRFAYNMPPMGFLNPFLYNVSIDIISLRYGV